MKQIKEAHIAIVFQPACANVYLIGDNGSRQRLTQDAYDFCRAFASGYAHATGLDIYCYACERGDATEQNWGSPRKHEVGYVA